MKRLSALLLAALLLAPASVRPFQQAAAPAPLKIKPLYPTLQKEEVTALPDRDRLFIASRGSNVITMDAVVTGYDLCYECTEKYPWEDAFGIGAAGIPVTPYHSVALPQEFPFGTKVKIADPSLSRYTFVAEDRGGAIIRLDSRTIKVDVLMYSHEEAQRFGKRNVKVTMILPE